MLFKKKRMIDVGDLHKRGKLIVPKDNVTLKPDKDGYVHIEFSEARVISTLPTSTNSATTTSTMDSSSSSESTSGGGFFDFFNSSTSSPQVTSSSSTTSSTSSDVYDKREVDSKIEKIDNILYRIEQRLDLIERKLGVSEY